MTFEQISVTFLSNSLSLGTSLIFADFLRGLGVTFDARSVALKFACGFFLASSLFFQVLKRWIRVSEHVIKTAPKSETIKKIESNYNE